MTSLFRSKRSALFLSLAVCISSLLTALVLLVAGAGTVRAQPQPPVIFVDANAPGSQHDGASWTTAFTTVQDALSIGTYGDEIWVAQGVYYPDEGADQTNDDPASTFTMIPGISLYGGFVGTETVRTQRDWASHLTVLSGDIDKDDQVTAGGVVTSTGDISGANAHHVVTGGGVTEAARLDGFVVTAGDATSDAPAPRGGGMANLGSSPTVANVSFIGNDAEAGGGMYNSSSSPSLSGLTFSGNQAETGGGMHNESSSSPTMEDVTFRLNMALNGAGMYNHNSSPTIENATFLLNVAWGSGGGMHNEASSNPTLTNATFMGNWVILGTDPLDPSDRLEFGGGGMRNDGSSPVLTHVKFEKNGVGVSGGAGGEGGGGGGMYNAASSAPMLDDVTFVDNKASVGAGMYNMGSGPMLNEVEFTGNEAMSGGGMLNQGSSCPRLTDVIFRKNSTEMFGGGMANTEGSTTTLSHVTFDGNESVTCGGGMYNLDSSPLITNTVFRGNSVGAEETAGAGGGLCSLGGSPRLTNVVFSGNCSSSTGGGMVLSDGNPTLMNVTFAGNTVEPNDSEYLDEVFVGGGLGVFDGSATLINCILADNQAPNGPQIGYVRFITTSVSTATIRFSTVQGSGGSGSEWNPEVGIDGGGNIDADPQFDAPVAASEAPTTTGDYRLQIGSPAIDTGTNGPVAVPTDLDGRPRITDGDGDRTAVVDMGAYELQTQAPVGGVTVTPSCRPSAWRWGLVLLTVVASVMVGALRVARVVKRP